MRGDYYQRYNNKDMSWQDYFERRDTFCIGGAIRHYEYKDKRIKTLPSDLPMPPNDIFYGLFNGCGELEDITALANWDVSNVKDMESMFDHCSQLKDITALANWDVSNLENMRCMFYYCKQLEDITALANWDVSNVKDMRCSFGGCRQLKDITAVANWDISNVKEMCSMFNHCDELRDITALANWDISNVKDMCCMFDNGELSISNNTEDIKSHLRNLSEQDHISPFSSLWERIKPLLKDTTPLNNHFKYYVTLDLPSDWQIIDAIQWNP